MSGWRTNCQPDICGRNNPRTLNGRNMPNLPTKAQADEAAIFMASEVHTPAFFQKLAAYGIQPRTEAEARQLLQMGAVLFQAESEGRYKSASAQVQEQENPFLSHVLGRLAPAQAQAPSPAQVDMNIKQAALEVAQTDPIAKAAALVYNYAMSGGELAEDGAE